MRLLTCALACATLTQASALEWPFNMRAERCRASDAETTVSTTGAVFRLRPPRGEIAFSQRIPLLRFLGTIKVDADAIRGLRIVSQDEEKAALQADSGLRIEVHCDSVLRVEHQEPLDIEVVGGFAPEYFRSQPGAVLALDERGGVGAYLPAEHPVEAEARAEGAGFAIADTLAAGQTFLLCVCPPREYNWDQPCLGATRWSARCSSRT